jgi:hypothetical protein
MPSTAVPGVVLEAGARAGPGSSRTPSGPSWLLVVAAALEELAVVPAELEFVPVELALVLDEEAVALAELAELVGVLELLDELLPQPAASSAATSRRLVASMRTCIEAGTVARKGSPAARSTWNDSSGR